MSPKAPKGKSARSLASLLAGFGAPAPDFEVTGVEMDSRRVSPGDLFIACKGQGTTHGLAYLEEALERGAAAVAWEPAAGWQTPEIPVPEVAVQNLSGRTGEIAARFFGRPSEHMFTVGITGTDGKTSTTFLAAQALDRLGTPCAYLGTIGFGRIGQLTKSTHTTPDPVALQRQIAQLREQGAEAVAMEVSSHALDQQRVAGMHFDVAILTNITRDHLDYHGTVENYAAAKKLLFTRPEVKHLVLNRDDEYGRAWIDEFSRLPSHVSRLTAYGLDGELPATGHWIVGRNLQLDGGGLSFDVQSSWGEARLATRLLGRFNAYNLMAALAAILASDVTLARAVEALSQATTVPGRIEGFRGPAAQPLVVVDYAHTPEALAQILRAVRSHVAPGASAGDKKSFSMTPATKGKLWCVFGCGGDRDRGKRPLMAAAAAAGADRVVVTDDNPRGEAPEAIVREILAGVTGWPLQVIHDRAAAITSAVRAAGPDDVVVVAGKGHEDYQIYGTEVRQFSDRAFVAQLVGAPAPEPAPRKPRKDGAP